MATFFLGPENLKLDSKVIDHLIFYWKDMKRYLEIKTSAMKGSTSHLKGNSLSQTITEGFLTSRKVFFQVHHTEAKSASVACVGQVAS